MTRTRKQPKTYNGFAIPLQPDTELGLAMLIAEDEYAGCGRITRTLTEVPATVHDITHYR